MLYLCCIYYTRAQANPPYHSASILLKLCVWTVCPWLPTVHYTGMKDSFNDLNNPEAAGSMFQVFLLQGNGAQPAVFFLWDHLIQFVSVGLTRPFFLLTSWTPLLSVIHMYTNEHTRTHGQAPPGWNRRSTFKNMTSTTSHRALCLCTWFMFEAWPQKGIESYYFQRFKARLYFSIRIDSTQVYQEIRKHYSGTAPTTRSRVLWASQVSDKYDTTLFSALCVRHNDLCVLLKWHLLDP